MGVASRLASAIYVAMVIPILYGNSYSPNDSHLKYESYQPYGCNRHADTPTSTPLTTINSSTLNLAGKQFYLHHWDHGLVSTTIYLLPLFHFQGWCQRLVHCPAESCLCLA